MSAATASPRIPQPTSFLVLAPVASANHPTSPPSKPTARTGSVASVTPLPDAATSTNPTTAAQQQVQPEPEPLQIPLEPKPRRSSSVSTTTSDGGGGRPRFLKLGPRHFGGDPEEGDFADEE